MGQDDGNISFDAQGNPISVNNVFLAACGCDKGPPCTAGGKKFTCPLGTAPLAGAGFDDQLGIHGSTGWLITTAPVAPNADFAIRWAVYDLGDGASSRGADEISRSIVSSPARIVARRWAISAWAALLAVGLGCSGGGSAASGGSGASTAASTGGASSSQGAGGSGGSVASVGSGGGGGAGGVAGAGGGGGDDGAPSDVYPAPHPNAPMVASLGGPVVASPKVVPIFFSNDDPAFTSQVKAFVAALGSSARWAAQTAEYGVGPMTSAPVDLGEAMFGVHSDSDLEAWLAGKLQANDALPAVDAGSIYAIYLPKDASFTLDGAPSCGDGYFGFHGEVALDAAHGGAKVPYAVIARCPTDSSYTDLEYVTAISSHELLEAATDPLLDTDPAYGKLDDEHFYWTFFASGTEVGDLCQSTTMWSAPADLGFEVERGWSNAAAAAGHDPCVPATTGEPYFNSAPVLEDAFKFASFTAKGVKIPAGTTRVVEVDLFSDAPTSGPWTVDAQDLSAFMGGTPKLSFSWDRTSGVNGEKLHLSITVLSGKPNAVQPFLLTSTLGTRKQYWVGVVQN